MSSQPTRPTPASPATAFLLGNRRPLAYALLALALASFAGGVYLFAKTFQATSKKADEAEVVKPVEDAEQLSLKLGTPEYILGGFSALTLAAVLGTAGVVTLVSLPKPTQAAREADARKALVLFGGLTGLTLTVVGFVFAVEWYRFLGEWLDTKTPPPGAYRFVLALLVFVVGAGLAFLSAQPARADERDDPLVRRLIFGMNLGLSTFLLLVLLVVANVFVTLKVPNKLDTTASGLYSLTLSEATTDYLAGLATPITVYTTAADEGPLGADVHRLLDACRDRNPAMVTVKYLSRSLNATRLRELSAKFPVADFSADGVLVTAGRDEERSAFIALADMVVQPDTRTEAGPPRAEFVGESKLMRELLFLADDKTKPVLYFTVGHGEFEVTPPDPGSPPVGPRRPTNTLRSTLEKSYYDVRPLRFDPANPAVPADATLVVIADPRTAFTAPEAAAIKAYLKAPATGAGKGGKLIVVAGPVPTPDRKGIVDVGLDGLLTDYGVTLGRKFIFCQPLQELSSYLTVAVLPDTADREGLLWREFGRERREFVMPLAREVIVGPASGPGGKAEPLMVTYPNRLTWLESEVPASIERSYLQVTRDAEVRVAKQAELGGTRVVAASYSEAGKAKVAVFGCGFAFLDDNPREPHGAEASAQLFSVTVNWLREQPPVANIAAKTYGFYSPERKLDFFRAGVLPVLMASLLTAALGVGVWIVRRK